MTGQQLMQPKVLSYPAKASVTSVMPQQQGDDKKAGSSGINPSTPSLPSNSRRHTSSPEDQDGVTLPMYPRTTPAVPTARLLTKTNGANLEADSSYGPAHTKKLPVDSPMIGDVTLDAKKISVVSSKVCHQDAEAPCSSLFTTDVASYETPAVQRTESTDAYRSVKVCNDSHLIDASHCSQGQPIMLTLREPASPDHCNSATENQAQSNTWTPQSLAAPCASKTNDHAAEASQTPCTGQPCAVNVLTVTTLSKALSQQQQQQQSKVQKAAPLSAVLNSEYAMLNNERLSSIVSQSSAFPMTWCNIATPQHSSAGDGGISSSQKASDPTKTARSTGVDSSGHLQENNSLVKNLGKEDPQQQARPQKPRGNPVPWHAMTRIDSFSSVDSCRVTQATPKEDFITATLSDTMALHGPLTYYVDSTSARAEQPQLVGQLDAATDSHSLVHCSI